MRSTPDRARLVVALVVSLLTASCGGGGTGPGGEGDLFMRFRANGVLHEETSETALFAYVYPATGNNSVVITTVTGTWHLSISIYDDDAIGSGTHTHASSNSLGPIVSFTSATGVDYATEIDSDAVVTITTLTDTRIGGTFTATVVESGQPDVSLTEGSFMTTRFN